jgi:hypothetical protein
VRPAFRTLLTCALPALAFLWLAAQPGHASGPENDWRIVAGERVGPIVPDTRHGDLARLFPGATVKYRFEALTANHITTIRGAGGLSITIYWSGKDGPAYAVHIHDPAGRWRTASGLAAGMTLRQVETLNGGSFLVGNFHAENEEAGATTGWEGGALPKGIQAVFTGRRQPTQRLVDGTHFRSGDRGLRHMRLRVTGFIVKFSRSGN